MKLCPSCDETKSDYDFHKMSRAKSGLQTYCKACQLEKENDNPARNERYLRYRAKWPGRTTWSFTKKRAERLGVPFSPMADFVAWHNAAARICEYCGIKEAEAKLKFSRNLHIDRKEGALGYVVGNMVLACRRCNEVKSSHLSHGQMKQVAGMFFGGSVNSHDALVKALESASAQCGNVIFNCEQRPADNRRHLDSWCGVKAFIDTALRNALVGQRWSET